ncbi:MAG TPA: sigma-70 family RNA polymerase sigma factor [Fimbriimonas sp.]|nr:sigma-70 family RNA polymerase sigma factor [Fimbriimonas sp.]
MSAVEVVEQVRQDPEELVARYMAYPRPELKDLIMVQYAGLVERLARKYAGLEPYPDLVQVGFIGLLNALSKYDADSGTKFTTYATHLVTGEIKHYLRDRSQTIRQPAWLQELRHKVNRTTGMLQQSSGKAPSAAEIARELGVSENSVQEVLNTQEMLRVSSLDSSGPMDDDGSPDLDRLDAAEACSEQVSVEERLVLEKAMSQLRDLERQVLVHFHFDSLNQSEIAKRLSISPNYVSHILRQAQAKLRKILEDEENKDRLLRSKSDLDLEIVDRQTGAYTEMFFRNRLQEELHRASSEDGDVAILIIEFRGLDSLRRFYGPDAIASFLTDAAEFLRSNVRRLDVVARYGTTGFGIILPFAGHNVSIVRDRLSQKTMQWAPSRTGGSEIISIQVGEAWAPKDGRNNTSLINVAQASIGPVML